MKPLSNSDLLTALLEEAVSEDRSTVRLLALERQVLSRMVEPDPPVADPEPATEGESR